MSASRWVTDHPDDRRDREMLVAYLIWLRRTGKVSRKAVAEYRGVSVAAVAKFEGKLTVNPQVEVLDEYAAAVGCRLVATVEGMGALGSDVDRDPAVRVLADAGFPGSPLTALARLAAARRLLGINPQQMGAVSGRTESAVRQIETAGGLVHVASVQSYARALAQVSGLPVLLRVTVERSAR